MNDPQKVAINIPRPPREVFEHSKINTTEFLTHQPQPIFVITKFEYPEEGGIYVWYEGVPYPRKGFPFPEAAQANNTAKRTLISLLKWLAKNPLAMISLLWKKNMENFLRGMAEIFRITLGQYYLVEKRYSINTREFQKLIKSFLLAYGMTEFTADGFSVGFQTIMEYDDAYMLRFQDLMSETTSDEMIKNPRGEFKRLLKILNERDTRVAVKSKFKVVVELASWGFLLPGVKKAFRKAIKSVDFSKLQFDDADRYNVLRWESYDFMGRTFEDRIKEYKEIHKKGLPRSFLLDSSWTHANREQGNGRPQ